MVVETERYEQMMRNAEFDELISELPRRLALHVMHVKY